MIAEVARYLQTRLDPHAIMVVLTPVPADSLLLLGQGLVWNATYDDGRLLGEVGISSLLAAGHLDVARSWLELSGKTDLPLYRLLQDEAVSIQERSSLSFDDRSDLLLADFGAERLVNSEELAALTELEDAGPGNEGLLDYLRNVLAGEPVCTPPSEDATRSELTPNCDPWIYEYISSGDHAGCRAKLDAWVRRLEATPPDESRWAGVAALCRFLTDDDDAAMAYLERARFCDARDDWKTIFGDTRIRAEQQAVLEQVEAAFDGVGFPGPRRTSLYQAEAADDYSSCTQDKDHKGRWQDLPREQIFDCQFALTYLGEHSLPYYLPAIMQLAVREREEERDDQGNRWIFESLEYFVNFGLEDEEQRERNIKRYSQMTIEQLAAIARFADYYGAPVEEVARWKHVAAGGDWPPVRSNDVEADA